MIHQNNAAQAAQQDDIIQPVLTDDEIIKHMEDAGVTFMWIEGRNPLRTTAGSQRVDTLLAGIRALLSKQIAPVADAPQMRRALEGMLAVFACGAPQGESPTIDAARAALASAPVADPWQPIATAPAGQRILLGPRHAPVVGWVTRYDDDEYPLSCSVVHYNGTVLVAGYHCTEWAPLMASAPVAPTTDRAMLQSVLQDLEKSESVCPRCGHSDSCADMDVAHMIRDHLKGEASAPVAGEAQLPWHVPVQYWTNEEKAKLDAAPQASPVAGEAQRRGKFLPEHVTQQMIWNVQAVIEAECNGLALDTRQARNVMSFLMNEHGPDAAPQASAEDDRAALAHKVNLLTAESLGHRSAAGHLSALVDELSGHLIEARQAMADFQQAFVPAFDTPETLTMVPNEALVPFCAVLDRLRGLDLPQADKDARPCTCPSGDGSLRHPCAVHPASATQPEQGERDE